MSPTEAHSRSRRVIIGPAVFVTAAFIGPGTVMTASSAGARFGYSLLWAVAFSILATIILQEMAARLGVVTGRGLAESLRAASDRPWIRWPLFALVLGGILFGNAAYQTGNLLGAATGLQMTIESWTRPMTLDADPTAGEATLDAGRGWLNGCVLLVAMLALGLIAAGRYRLIQQILTALVALMGILFTASAIWCGPDLVAIASGFNLLNFVRRGASSDEMWLVVGLIGTTVVPYNLFLHASAAARRWADVDSKIQAVRQSFLDTLVSVTIGGVITASLLITGAVAFGGEAQLERVADVALQLRPILGDRAELVFGLGLFAAGFTSSVTAPIAAAWATAGCFGWGSELRDFRLKLVAAGVIATGTFLAITFGGSPKDAIVVAQVANGILLPVIVAFLLVAVNRPALMGSMRNGWVANILGVAVLLLTGLLSARMLRPVVADILSWFTT